MEYYIIKTHYIPTAKNNGKYAVEHNWYSGKAGHEMNTVSVMGDMTENKPQTMKFYLENYAYKRLCDAKKGLKAAQELHKAEMEWGFWTITDEIITVEG